MRANLFLKDHFHTGYAVRDIDQAVASMRERLGIADWKIMRVSDKAPRYALGFAYVGNTMIELVEADGDQVPFYKGWIPDNPANLRIHHQGYFASDREQFDEVRDQFEAQGFAMACDLEMPGVLNFRYFDTTDLLGHYSEFVLMQPGGDAFWEDVPRN